MVWADQPTAIFQREDETAGRAPQIHERSREHDGRHVGFVATLAGCYRATTLVAGARHDGIANFSRTDHASCAFPETAPLPDRNDHDAASKSVPAIPFVCSQAMPCGRLRFCRGGRSWVHLIARSQTAVGSNRVAEPRRFAGRATYETACDPIRAIGSERTRTTMEFLTRRLQPGPTFGASGADAYMRRADWNGCEAHVRQDLNGLTASGTAVRSPALTVMTRSEGTVHLPRTRMG
jgi:hypothetical protein